MNPSCDCTHRTRRRGARRIALLCVVVCGCALGRTSFLDLPTRAAIDAPSRFVLDAAAPEEGMTAIPGQGCRSPLFDPRDGARIQLIRSAADRGDYEPPSGRYGVSARELLRLRCSTGEVLGVVER
jgi:hypothetical protein